MKRYSLVLATTTATARTASPASIARRIGTNAGPILAKTEPPASTRSPTSTAPVLRVTAVIKLPRFVTQKTYQGIELE